MALFQKKPVVESSAPLYQLGLETTLLIAGLGNVGKQYEGTRHNIGFATLDYFASKQGFENWLLKKELKCALTSHSIGNARVILIKPTTYMNKSGEAVQAVQHFYRVPSEKTLIVHDDIDINFGQIRLRTGGSDAGNNGMKSVIAHGGESTQRVRIGIGPKKPVADLPAGRQVDSADFVLAKFSKAEDQNLPLLFQESTAILSEFAHASGNLPTETRSFII